MSAKLCFVLTLVLMLLVNNNNTHFHRKNWRSGFITYVQTWRRISKQNKILILMHVSISVLMLFPLENFFHVKDWESALLPQMNLKMGGWKFFLEAGGVVRQVTCGFTQREPQEIGTKISQTFYVSLPVSCSKRWLVCGTTVKKVSEVCGCNSRH